MHCALGSWNFRLKLYYVQLCSRCLTHKRRQLSSESVTYKSALLGSSSVLTSAQAPVRGKALREL